MLKLTIEGYRSDLNVYYNGPKYYNILYNILNEFRRKVKYTEEKGSWEEAYRFVVDLINEEKIEIEW